MRQGVESAAFDKLKGRILALRAKTVGNGCTEEEALAAAAKVAELLDRHDLSLSDVELRQTACVQLVFETHRKQRIPIADCIGAVAQFCDCRVWREKTGAGETRYVFFGLPADAEVALYLIGLIDEAVRASLGRYKTGPDYLRFRHQDRHLVNASFALGMVPSIADRLGVMKAERDGANRRTGRDLVLVKTSIVDEDLARLGLHLQTSHSRGRMVAPDAFAAGGAEGMSLPIVPGIRAAAG